MSLLAIVSIAVIILGASLAFAETKIKNILIYAALSQLAYISLMIGLNNHAARRVAFEYALVCLFGLAGIILSAAAVKSKCGIENLGKNPYILKSMPLSAVAFILCAFSLIGIPPLAGFLPKVFTLFILIEKGLVWAALAVTLSYIFTLIYLLRLFQGIFLGENPKAEVNERSPLAYAAFASGALSLFLGFAVKPAFGTLTLLLR